VADGEAISTSTYSTNQPMPLYLDF